CSPLEWTIVVEQPGEPPGERDRRSRKNKNLWAPALRASATRPGLPWALIIIAGTRARGPERSRRTVLTKAGPGQRLHEVRGHQEIGGRPSQRVDGFGRAFVCVNPTRSDGREHRPHDQEHRPPIVDDRHGKRGEIAAKSAMVQHGTQPTRRIGFPRADQATGRLVNRASIVLLKGGEITSKNGVSLQSPHRLSTLHPQDGPQPLVVW